MERDSQGLPEVVYVPDLAAFLRISEKAVRHRAARGQLPRPFKSGKALAWTREDVITWLRECGRAAGPAKMKIKLRPYAHDTTRFHVDIRFMNPTVANETIRRRLVAPPGLDEKQARTWGERQVPLILRELVGGSSNAGTVESQKESSTIPRAPRMTLAEFYERRFLPEHVALQKRATRDSWAAGGKFTSVESVHGCGTTSLSGVVPSGDRARRICSRRHAKVAKREHARVHGTGRRVHADLEHGRRQDVPLAVGARGAEALGVQDRTARQDGDRGAGRVAVDGSMCRVQGATSSR